jgi:hypothetical protein
MTALSADFPRASSPEATTRRLSVPVAAATTIYMGALVATLIGGSGYATNATADNTYRVLGVAAANATNTTAAGYGAAGDINVEVERGVFPFANSATTDEVTAADVGEICYVADNNTVARTSNGGLRPVAGYVSRIEGGKVWVEIGASVPTAQGHIDLLFPAAGDYSTTGQNRAMALNGSSKWVHVTTAGAKAQGILLNAPVADAIAIVRVFGPVQALAGDTIADGAYCAVEGTNGRMKTAVAATVAGGAGDPANDAVVGSHVLGFALSDGTTGALFRMFVNPMGAIPTTAA